MPNWIFEADLKKCCDKKKKIKMGKNLLQSHTPSLHSPFVITNYNLRFVIRLQDIFIGGANFLYAHFFKGLKCHF